jgi:hypothetical protein
MLSRISLTITLFLAALVAVMPQAGTVAAPPSYADARADCIGTSPTCTTGFCNHGAYFWLTTRGGHGRPVNYCLPTRK